MNGRRIQLVALLALQACSPAPAPRAPIQVDADEVASTAPTEARQPVEFAMPMSSAIERTSLIPQDLAGFDIQSIPPPLEELRAKAAEEIGPGNADRELEKLKAEFGERRP
jgi:hypothetical protein